MIMKLIIDRIEENYVVVELEDGRIVDMAKNLFPSGVKEEDVIEIREEE